MGYPRQDSVVSRLQAINLSYMSRAADRAQGELLSMWRHASRLLKADIASAYQASSPRGGRWDLTTLQASGTYQKLSMRAGSVLGEFLGRSKARARTRLNDLKGESAERHAWALGQAVPHPERVKYRKTGANREADIPLSSGFDERWGEWVGGYHEALMRNVRMGALNQSGITDAIAEVDATRVSTPAYTLEAALDRLWGYYSWEAVTGGMHQVFEENGEAEQEIWRTSGDLRVCDECDANEGLPVDEADGTIPLHPNCNCFPQLVPASYAALLRSGDEEDRALAEEMDLKGIAPNAMVVRGADGEIKGRLIVDFEEWKAAQGEPVRGGI